MAQFKIGNNTYNGYEIKSLKGKKLMDKSDFTMNEPLTIKEYKIDKCDTYVFINIKFEGNRSMSLQFNPIKRRKNGKTDWKIVA